MTHARTARTTTGAATLLAGLALTMTAACSTQSTAATPTSTTARPPAPATSTAATSSDIAISQAQQVITNYYAVYNQVNLNPSGDRTSLSTVLSGQALSDINTQLDGSVARGLHGSGQVVVATAVATDVNITGPNAQANFDYCVDVSNANGVTADGKIQNNPNRPPRVKNRFVVTDTVWPDTSEWRITATEQRNEPC